MLRVGTWLRRCSALAVALGSISTGAQETGDCKLAFETPSLTWTSGAGGAATVTWADTGVTPSHDDESGLTTDSNTATPCEMVTRETLTEGEFRPKDMNETSVTYYYHRRQVGSEDDPGGEAPPAGSRGLQVTSRWLCVVPVPGESSLGTPFGEAGQDVVDLNVVTDQVHLKVYDDTYSLMDALENGCRERTGRDNTMRLTGLADKTAYDVYVGVLWVPRHHDYHLRDDKMQTTRMPFGNEGRARVYASSTPGRPPNLQVPNAQEGVVEVATGGVLVTWEEAFSWTEPNSIQRYEYRTREVELAEITEWSGWVTVGGGSAARQVEVRNLRVGGVHEIQVRAVNTFGDRGGDTSLARVELVSEPILRQVNAESIGDGVGKVRLQWEVLDTGGGSIERYEYRYRRIEAGEDCDATPIVEDFPWTSAGSAP